MHIRMLAYQMFNNVCKLDYSVRSLFRFKKGVGGGRKRAGRGLALIVQVTDAYSIMQNNCFLVLLLVVS